MGEAKASKGKGKRKAPVDKVVKAAEKAIEQMRSEPACRCNNAAIKHLEAAIDWRGKRDV